MPSKPAVVGVSGAYTSSELAGLTVPQLKALCKEKKISGYSKLGKQALIQKLSGLGPSTTGGPGPTSNAPVVSRASPPTVTTPLLPPNGSSAASQRGQTSDLVGSKETPPCDTAARPLAANTDTSKATTKPRARSTKTSSPATENPSVADINPSSEDRYTVHMEQPTLAAEGVAARATSPAPNSLSGRPGRIPQVHALASPSLNAHLSVSGTRVATAVVGSSFHPPSSNKRIRQSVECMPPPSSKRSRLLPPASTPNLSETIASSAPALGSSKRFIPLVVDKSKFQSSPLRPPARLASDRSVAWPSEAPLTGLELDCLTTVPELFPITMPPTLSHRKRVQRWAVILSGLSNAERAVCVLVSRAFRYAVYLSAASILTRECAGRRLQEDVLCKYSQAMTNMWPYLRLREAEVARGLRIYEASFISRFFQKLGLPNPIATRVWASPDNPKQLSVAIRFALTRAWFEFSVGSPRDSRTNPDSWLRGTVVDVQEVVPVEVWSVTIEYAATLTRPRRRDTLYVLEGTCEVIGRPALGMSHSVGDVGYPLRVDWSTYIAHRMAMTSSTDTRLLSHLKWACQEDYDRGISTLWLRRTAAEDHAGAAKRTVAERYVMASVVGNSISGQWMTTNEMAQEFAGLPARVGARVGRKTATLNLFLPEHHHVESVHFSATGGRDLHPALAVVQTPHREYYVLRDNGMQVGCEEDGVAEAWQEVLRCDTRGLSLSS